MPGGVMYRSSGGLRSVVQTERQEALPAIRGSENDVYEEVINLIFNAVDGSAARRNLDPADVGDIHHGEARNQRHRHGHG